MMFFKLQCISGIFKHKVNVDDNINNIYFDNKNTNEVKVNFKKILTSQTRSITEFFKKPYNRFLLDFNDNFVYFIVENRLYQFNFKNFPKIKSKYIIINNLKNNHNTHISVNKEEIIITTSEKEIIFLNHNLDLIKVLKNKCQIITKVLKHGANYFFTDISDSIITINDDDFLKNTPEEIGDSFYNPHNNILIFDNKIIYGSSASVFYIVNKNSLEQEGLIHMYSKFNYLKNAPVLYKNSIILNSDVSTKIIDKDTLVEQFEFQVGSFTQPIIFKDYLILGNENKVFIINLKNNTLNSLYLEPSCYVIGIFEMNSMIFVLDSFNRLSLINFNRNCFTKIKHPKIKSDFPPKVGLFNNKNCLFILNEFMEFDVYTIQEN